MRKNEKPRAFSQEEKDAMAMRNDAIDKLRNTDSTGYWQMPNESDKYKERGPSKDAAIEALAKELQLKAAKKARDEAAKHLQRGPSKNAAIEALAKELQQKAAKKARDEAAKHLQRGPSKN